MLLNEKSNFTGREIIEKGSKGLIKENEKDAPILAAAITGKVDWLLSLDKHFLHSNVGEEFGFQICAPGEFLRKLPVIQS